MNFGPEQKQKNGIVAAVKEGKYLTFRLANEIYGVEVMRVVEITGMVEATKVPRTPQFVRGVINLRGAILPVIDMRIKFGMENAADKKQTCIVVLEITTVGGKAQMGIVVDSVEDVLDIYEKDVEAAPSFGVEINTEFIHGMAKTDKGVIILLNIDKVLTTDEIAGVFDAGIINNNEGNEKEEKNV